MFAAGNCPFVAALCFAFSSGPHISGTHIDHGGRVEWGWVWGQFLDHTFGLRNEKRGKSVPIPFDSKDPLERFKNDLNAIDFALTPAAPGTGAATPRHQINTVPSFIDAFAVYGSTDARLEWLRKGPVNGTLSDSSPSLLLPGKLPPARERSP